MQINLQDRVAIVTGSGNGLGRSHALALAARGAKIVVNDLVVNGENAAAERVADEIRELGGEAIVSGADVSDQSQVNAMVEQAISSWGKVDILVNNAGVLRDKSFGKSTLADFELVLKVHLIGSYLCTKAVWDNMRENQFGRIVMTTSVSGLYGNFGQANYAAAKMGLVGLMNTLHIEGEKHNIRVNAIAPTAYTQMLEGLLDEETAQLLSTDSVSPGLVYLVSEDSPSKMILGAGAGGFAVNHIYETPGKHFRGDMLTPENIADAVQSIASPQMAGAHENAFGQTNKFAALARSNEI